MAAVVGVAGLPPATAQEADDLTVEVSDCAELASPEARLACFDAQVEAARRARPGSDQRAAAPSASAPPPAVRSEPVRSAAPVRSSNERPDSRDSRESESVEFVARVAELRETVPNSYLITLDNGQVWRQTRPLAYPLKEGHEVRIYTQGRFGHRLTNRELRGFIAVERVR